MITKQVSLDDDCIKKMQPIQVKQLSMIKDLERIRCGYKPRKHFHNVYSLLMAFAVIRLYITQLWRKSFQFNMSPSSNQSKFARDNQNDSGK